MKTSNLLGCAAALAVWTPATVAHAQAVADASERTAPRPGQNATDANEIVVTAQKRVQNINDVGLTIAALGGNALKERQVTSLADLAQLVPGLSFTQSGANTPVYTLRGVGFYETSLAAYPDVSVYLDEAPLSFPTLTQLTAFDLERAEVLKGPQGTLFGQNATGGAINYIAAKPTQWLEAGGSITYGRFNDVLADAYISGPISTTLSGRISGRVERADDWQKSYTTDATTGKTRTYAARAQLSWKPVDELRVNLNLNGWKNGSDPQAIQYIAYNPQFDIPNPLVGYAFAPQTPRAADFSNTVGSATPTDRDRRIGINDRLLQGTLRIDYDVLDSVSLTSLTNFVDYKHQQTFDGDGTTLNAFDVPFDAGTIKSFFQEVRLTSSGSRSFRWILGANYGKDRVFQDTAVNYRQSSVNSATGITTGGTRNVQRMENYAFFGNADFDLTPTVTLSGGVRYTEAKRHFDGCTYDIPGGGVAQLFGFIGNQVRAAQGLPALPAIAPGACAVLNNLTAPRGNIVDPGTYESTNFVDNLDQHNVSYRAGATWKPAPGILLYGNVTKGFKSGSYPTVSASGVQQMLPVVQESVLSYEGGIKATMLDGALQANAAGFYYDYKDKQVRSKLIDPVFGILDNLVNVPKSRVTGGEIELTAHPVRGATFYANYTFVNAKVLRYSGINAAGVSADFAGTPLPYAPKHQIAVGGSYEWPLSNSLNAQIGADLAMRSSAVAIVGGGSSATPVASIPVHGDPYRIASYATLDLRAGVKTPDGRYSLQVWGKNVTNSYYWSNVVAFYDTIGRYTGRPATYGVTLGVSFK